MNQKQLIGLIVAGLILGGVGYSLYNKDKGGWSSAPRSSVAKLIGDFPLNDVDQITIKAATNSVTLSRSDSGWSVKERGGYGANFDDISGLLTKVWELKPVDELELGQEHLGRLNLQEPGKGDKAGTLVEFKTKNGKSHSLLLGKEHQRPGGENSQFGGGMPDGRYVMIPGKLDTVSLVTETFSNVQDKPEQWLDKSFLKVERIKSIEYKPIGAVIGWKVSRESESGEWKLANAKPEEKLDSAKVSSFNYFFSSPSFNDVAAADAKPETTGMDKPSLLVIETFDTFTYTVKVGKNTDENTLQIAVDVKADIALTREAKPEEKDVDRQMLDKQFKEKKEKLEKKLADEQKFSKWVYLVTKWTVDSAMKDRKDLLVEEKKDEKKDGDAASTPPIPFAPPK